MIPTAKLERLLDRFHAMEAELASGMADAVYPVLLGAILLAFYGGWLVLWVSYPQTLYTFLMHLWGVGLVNVPGPAYAHSPLPFFDLEAVLSWHECSLRGFDVYAVNICDPYNRTVGYSPVLVGLPLEWIGTRHTLLLGVIIDAAFLMLLPFVLRPRTQGEFGLAVAAVLSQSVLFALERSNLDVLIFILIAGAALLSQRSLGVRLLFYGVSLLAGLAKLYPIALLLTVVREKALTAVLATAFSFVVLAAFAIGYWDELSRIQLPPVRIWGDMFGAAIFLHGVPQILHLPASAAIALASVCIPALVVAAVGLGNAIQRARPDTDWNASRQIMMLSGSIIVVGCFFAQSSVAYRAIFLLLVLPGLVDLYRTTRGTQLGRTLFWALAATLGCLWSEFLRVNFMELVNFVGAAGPDSYVGQCFLITFFLLREAMWWFEVGVLAAIIICFVLHSTAVRDVRRWLTASA